MKHSKFIFVPMLVTTVFIFPSLSVNAAEVNNENELEPVITEKIHQSATSGNYTYTEENVDSKDTPISENSKPVRDNDAQSASEYDSANTVTDNTNEQNGKSTSIVPEQKTTAFEKTVEEDLSNENTTKTDRDEISEEVVESSPETETLEITEERTTEQEIEEDLPNQETEIVEVDSNSEEEITEVPVEEKTISEAAEKKLIKTDDSEKTVNDSKEINSLETTEEESLELAEDTEDDAINIEENNEEYEKDELDSLDGEKAEKEIQTFGLSTDRSIKLFSFETIAKSENPIVSHAQYAARFTDSKHSGLYSPVTSSKAVSLDFIDDKTVYITQKAVYNGTTYYRVHKDLDGPMQGWVKEQDLRLFSISDSVKHTKDYAVSRDKEYLLTNPWGTSAQTVKRLDKYDTQLFRAEERLELGVLTFYYGQIGEDYGWLADSRLKAASAPKVTKESYAAKLNTNKSSGLYSPVTSRASKNLDFLKDKTLYITQRADYNGTIFYRVHQNYDGAMQGWIQKEDLDLWILESPVTHKKDYSIARKKEYLLKNPWGSSKQTVKKLSSYGDSLFKAEKKLNLGVLTYYYGKIGNDYGWLEETRVKEIAPVVTSARFAARVDGGNNSGIFSPVTSEKGKKMGVIQNQTLYITQKATYNGTTFYRVHSNLGGAIQGWIKEKDLNLYRLTNPVTHNKKYTVARKNEHLLTNPWGTSSQRVAQLSKYGNSVFQAEKSLQLGVLRFYYGKIGSDYGWVQDNRLEVYKPVAPSPSPTIKTVKYNQTFNQVLNTQINLSSRPQAWANGGGWRNATRSEVARFLDTSHQTSETWMYTFLDLDRSQNIASSKLNNKLLSGKGTLSNQGSAFLSASKTHGINEVYLISHAIHETGNGTSTLAQGVRLDSNGNISSNGKKYYNMYGVGAYDYNPVLAGARYAQQMGWDTPAKAIIGGARFISHSYFNRGQTTLYSMRWNPLNPGTYQYATDVNWAYATARNLQNYYQQLGIRGQYYTKHIF